MCIRDRYEVFKKYPSSLEIKIEKTNFLASTNINGKNYLVGSNGKFINTKNFYHFPSGRWDIEMISGVLIKLPITGIKESLNLSIDLLDDIEFSNIKILDIRQKNQIVIND